MSRVVVVGAGLGGCLAALATARRDPDSSVHLVSVAPERYRYEPGTIDVLGYTGEDGPVERPFFGMRSLPGDHPYNLVGHRAVRDALEFFDELLEGDETLPYRGGHSRNALVPTARGGARPTSRYPEGMAAGLVSDQRKMFVVGFDQLTHLDAELVGDRLEGAVPYDVESTTVEFPVEPSTSPPFEELGRALDENRETGEGVPLREALADAVRPELDIEPRVGFPAVLGVEDHGAVRRDLASLLQAEVFEIPVGEPSLPGIRLRDRLFDLVEEAGIERIEGAVREVDAEDGLVRSVTVGSESGVGHSHTADAEDDGPGAVTVEGDTFVLATGGVAAGGLVGTREAIVEPVFGCPTTETGAPGDRSAAGPLGDHPFARAGVEVNDKLQPVTADGKPVYENLVAAGTALGGHNFVRERSRGGVAVVTGHVAGRQALDLA